MHKITNNNQNNRTVNYWLLIWFNIRLLRKVYVRRSSYQRWHSYLPCVACWSRFGVRYLLLLPYGIVQPGRSQYLRHQIRREDQTGYHPRLPGLRVEPRALRHRQVHGIRRIPGGHWTKSTDNQYETEVGLNLYFNEYHIGISLNL